MGEEEGVDEEWTSNLCSKCLKFLGNRRTAPSGGVGVKPEKPRVREDVGLRSTGKSAHSGEGLVLELWDPQSGPRQRTDSKVAFGVGF